MNKSAEKAYEEFKSQLENNLKNRYLKFKDRDIVLWGTGVYGNFLFQFLKSIGLSSQIKAFCITNDNSSECNIENTPVYSFKRALSLFPKAVFIIANDYYEQILKYLADEKVNVDTYVPNQVDRLLEKQLIYYYFGFNKNNVVGFNYTWFEIYHDYLNSGVLDSYLNETMNLLEDQKSKDILNNRIQTFLSGDLSFISKIPVDKPTYFSNSYFGENDFSDNEVLFDCGAFTGDSIADFIYYQNKKYKKILAFEPDPKNFKVLSDYIKNKNINNVEPINVATGSETGEIGFHSTENMNSIVVKGEVSSSDKLVKIVKLDDYFNERPTLIKMDIEGAELDSLKGASEIISKLKPKLAICIYHLPLDFYEIPKYLKTLVPEYKFKIRQHEDLFWETVLYAYI